jgi:hypothetical protein
MTNLQSIRGINVGCRVAVVLISSVAPLFAANAPVRLGIKVAPATISVDGTATITVEFLNRDFRPVPNDRDRNVRLEIRETGGKAEGKGVILPPTARVSAGATSYSKIQMTAKTAGTLRVWAASDGLEPGEALVRIGSTSALLSRLFLPVLEAQAPSSSFQLLPRDLEIALSAAPTAVLGIVADRPLAQKRRWRITTTPAVPIRFDEDVKNGYGVVEVGAGESMSHQMILEPSGLGPIDVTATLLPDGEEMRAKVRVVPQVAKRISLTMEHDRLPPTLTLLPLKITLVDENGAPLKAVSASHDIELKSMTSGWNLAPQRLTLSDVRLAQNLTVQLPHVRLGAILNLIASDDVGALEPGEKQFQVLAARWAVVLLAIAAGLLGGLARWFYRERETDFLPHRVDGRLKRGLILDACFSGLFGVILFLLVDVGLLHQFAEQLEHDETRVAFLLGVSGGFAGILVLQSMSKWMVGFVSRLPSNSPVVRTH